MVEHQSHLYMSGISHHGKITHPEAFDVQVCKLTPLQVDLASQAHCCWSTDELLTSPIA